MAYIRTIAEAEADGLLAELYAKRLAAEGSVPNHMKAMSLRPEAIQAWQQLVSAIRPHLDLRMYELVTIAAASAVRCTY
jgi:alkylhydroperoxidase/carboxymuconolactone decarboxylase family protein YurZ